MPAMKHKPHILGAVLALCMLTSSAQTPAEPESQRLARELRDLIGPAACHSDSQCRTVAVGARPCGGPAGYWAWSTQGTDAERLTTLAQRQAAAEKAEQQARGLRSNCRVLTDPGAICVANQCQTRGLEAAREPAGKEVN